MALVEAVAVVLLELDAVAFDAIDGADMHAVGADDLHVVLDVLLRHGALPGCRSACIFSLHMMPADDAGMTAGVASSPRPSHTGSNSSAAAFSGFLPLKVRPVLVAESFTC